MNAELLKTLGQITGIGGVALGVFLILFRELIRKSIFPALRKDDAFRRLRLIALLLWIVGLAGIGAWVVSAQVKGKHAVVSMEAAFMSCLIQKPYITSPQALWTP